jgi:tetratricopeptide (TPR) repeat protein
MITEKVWSIYDQVGSTANANGHHRLAQQMFSAALDTCANRKSLKQEKMKSLVGLADSYLLQNQIDDAERLYKRVLNSMARSGITSSTDKHIFAHVLENLAYIIEKRGGIEESLKMLRRSLRLSEQIVGSNHPSLVHRLRQISAMHTKLGDADGAMRTMNRAKCIQSICGDIQHS